jgi:solute carrier family 25 protein 34/35
MQYKGLTHAFWSILKLEGLSGIQKGLFLAYPYTILMNGTRLGLYEYGKKTISKVTGLPSTNVGVGILSGAFSGVLGSILGNPFYIAKTRLQSQSAYLPVGHQHIYKGPLSALSGILREEGVKGLYRGTQAACIRMTAASPVQLVTYGKSNTEILLEIVLQPCSCMINTISTMWRLY